MVKTKAGGKQVELEQIDTNTLGVIAPLFSAEQYAKLKDDLTDPSILLFKDVTNQVVIRGKVVPNPQHADKNDLLITDLIGAEDPYQIIPSLLKQAKRLHIQECHW